MAIIIETCPKCGHDLIDEVICTNPPIPKKGCPNCGWCWEGEPEKVIRVPFGGNSYWSNSEYTLVGSRYDEPFNIDDSCCSLNNIDGHAFVTTSNLSNSTINHEKIIESIERAMRYRRIKQGFYDFKNNRKGVKVMTATEISSVVIVGVLGLIVIGGALLGITFFLDKAAEYEAKAKRYFEDR